MVEKKARIVIVGAGMAGLTAANKLYTASGSKDLFELCVVEGGTRIGGRINTSEFMGNRIEMGATWIHGIGGSPVHKIAEEINALDSEQPWECMDGCSGQPTTVAEGGFELSPSTVEPISSLFKKLMDYAQGKTIGGKENDHCILQANNHGNGLEKLSVGSFLRKGLDLYWVSKDGEIEPNGYGKWSKKSLEEAIFAMHENTQRTYTSAGELSSLDFCAESEYQMFPGEEITIANGYLSIIESIASVLPPGLVELGKKVTQIEWQPEGRNWPGDTQSGDDFKPVKLHFSDGSVMSADHAIITVSLGVLKAATHQDSGMFNPPLPSFKTEAISRLGYGVVNKLFLHLAPAGGEDGGDLNSKRFPFLNFVFHQADSEFRHKRIPWWMRRTASLHPIYPNSSVLLSWFAGEEALHLEKLHDEEIINGVSTTISNFLPQPHEDDLENNSNSQEDCNGHSDYHQNGNVKFTKVLKSQWGTDPLFLGSYSYVAVGSSGEDLDAMAEPLPRTVNINNNRESPKSSSLQLQLLFAGEATHRTHYSTTHGAYFSGLREANRLLHHYNCV